MANLKVTGQTTVAPKSKERKPTAEEKKMLKEAKRDLKNRPAKDQRISDKVTNQGTRNTGGYYGDVNQQSPSESKVAKRKEEKRQDLLQNTKGGRKIVEKEKKINSKILEESGRVVQPKYGQTSSTFNSGAENKLSDKFGNK